MLLTEEEINIIRNNSGIDKKLAEAFLDGSWGVLSNMINQVYGYPKQTTESREFNPVSILPKGMKGWTKEPRTS